MKTCTTEGCTRKVLARGLCPTHYSYWYRANHTRRINCEWCGAEFEATRPQIRYCSRLCGIASVNGKHVKDTIARRLPVIYTGPPYVQPAVHVHTANRLTSGQCRICSAWFVSVHADITCSPQCLANHEANRSHAKAHRRRARKRQAYVADVNRQYVFNRDGWRCYLCRKRINPALRHPHRMSATIDHITPLARGGTHEPANVRAAHLICNSTKTDLGGGEQLLLIG